jgi:C1A family cysteine protease
MNYRITTYSKIVETDKDAIKTMIVNNHPVMATVTIDGNFRNAYPGYIWNSYSGFSGNHAVTICGYDDTKNAYKVINCWGTSWGDAGYTWIDYDFFPTVSSYYVYVIN